MGGHSVIEMAEKPVAVEMNAISKRFGGVHALRDVSLSVRRGEIHALLGENGAGKSTILKILRGVQAPDSGSIVIGEGRSIASRRNWPGNRASA